MPDSQAVVGGRSVWSRPVVRSRQSSGAARLKVWPRPYAPVRICPPGGEALRGRFARGFFSVLWDNPSMRKRWALRWRATDAAGDLADGLALEVVTDLSGIVPVWSVAHAVRHTILDDWAVQRELGNGEAPVRFGLVQETSRLLEWLVDPSRRK